MESENIVAFVQLEGQVLIANGLKAKRRLPNRACLTDDPSDLESRGKMTVNCTLAMMVILLL
jgi:hypothetical protein